MDFALSTNWCNRRLKTGEAIVDAALALGFKSLELGYHTTDEQVVGFKRRLDEMPVGSIHAFAPIPLSAPQGYPELYTLASFDEEARNMARFQVIKNIRFAAEMGADALVLHMGRVPCRGWFSRFDMRRRLKRGKKMVEIAARELDLLMPELEKHHVTLALENLPYLEGFPGEWELMDLLASRSSCVRGWLDTGHDAVRARRGWRGVVKIDDPERWARAFLSGIHVNDILDKTDDHLPPGKGTVDFGALSGFARGVRHIVFEPNDAVPEADLRAGIARLAAIWYNNNV